MYSMITVFARRLYCNICAEAMYGIGIFLRVTPPREVLTRGKKFGSGKQDPDSRSATLIYNYGTVHNTLKSFFMRCWCVSVELLDK